MKLTESIRLFFLDYLVKIKNSSAQTVASYKVTFRIFLPFAAGFLDMKIGDIYLSDISTDLVLSFLEHLEEERNNSIRTRNQRLAALKSLARMIRLLCPEDKETAGRILNIPQKRAVKTLLGFLTPDEITEVFNAVSLEKNQGFRDYTILRMMYDSAARASELSDLECDSIDSKANTLGILGKGNRWRLVQLWPETVRIAGQYVKHHRIPPVPLFSKYLFINQRREKLTRQGIYKICRKHLKAVLPEKRFKQVNPAHCFRHSCAVHMLMDGKSLAHIKNHLGHENINSTMIYLNLDLSRRKAVQNNFVEYTRSVLAGPPEIDELIDWKNKEEVLSWLDSL